MSELTRQVVAGFLADLGGVWLAEDVEFVAPSGHRRHGRADAARWFAHDAMFGLGETELHLDRLLIDGGSAAAECHLTGMDVTPGTTVSLVGLFDVDGGEIVRLRVYRDEAAVMSPHITRVHERGSSP